MIDKRLYEMESRINNVFSLTELCQDDETKSHLSKYLCILTSGYIERSIIILTEEYVKKHSAPKITNFVSETIKRTTNINSDKLVSHFSKFDSTLREKMIEKMSDQERSAIDSVLANRNQIAHGQNVGISFVSIRQYFLEAKSTVRKIRLILNI